MFLGRKLNLRLILHFEPLCLFDEGTFRVESNHLVDWEQFKHVIWNDSVATNTTIMYILIWVEMNDVISNGFLSNGWKKSFSNSWCSTCASSSCSFSVYWFVDWKNTRIDFQYRRRSPRILHRQIRILAKWLFKTWHLYSYMYIRKDACRSSDQCKLLRSPLNRGNSEKCRWWIKLRYTSKVICKYRS